MPHHKLKNKLGEPSSKELKEWGYSSRESADIQRRKDTGGIKGRIFGHKVRKEDIHLTPERKRDFSILGKIGKGYKQVRELSKTKKKKK